MKQMGMDPEFFIVNRKTNRARSAHEEDLPSIKGSFRGYNGYTVKVYRDGPAFEMGHSPTYCRDWLIPNIYRSLAKMYKEIQDFNKNHGTYYALSFDATVHMNRSSINPKTAPEDVFSFGCNPDWDAYTLSTKAPTMPEKFPWRFAGGHMHFSTDNFVKDSLESKAIKAMLLDYFLAIPMVAILGESEGTKERLRRQWYGQAGSFRDKPYGLEYRTLSSAAYFYHPIILYSLYSIGRIVSYAQLTDICHKRIGKLPLAEVRDAVNTHDVPKARALFEDEDIRKQYIAMCPSSPYPTKHNEKSDWDLLRSIMMGKDHGIEWPKNYSVRWALKYDLASTGATLDHNYWGNESALRGRLDDIIYPQGKLIGVNQTRPSLRWPSKEDGKTNNLYWR